MTEQTDSPTVAAPASESRPPEPTRPGGEPTGADPAARVAWAEDATSRFEALYERLPSWEIGRPQPAFVALAEAGAIRGTVLDAGCGTGENALYLAERGFEVWGIDLAPSAIGMAREKARARGLPASRFLLADALDAASLGLGFETVIDCGLLHAMVDAERAAYVAALAAVVVPGGLVHLLCYADLEPGETGPRRISAAELREAFAGGWRVCAIREARLHTNIHREGARAWLASFERLRAGRCAAPRG